MNIKSNKEINKIRIACQLISKVHKQVQKLNVIGKSELEIQKSISGMIKAMNIDELAFPIILGSGVRSLILHAEPTEKIVTSNDLVLIDMGVKYEGYCSDMTRTWPANGDFLNEQKIIYDIVKNAQQDVLKSISTHQSLASLHDIAKQSLCRGLDSAELKGLYDIHKIYPHKTSHWIGQDVHDGNIYLDEKNQPISLQAGMCFTVEPGLYIQNTNTKFDGIGIRIEDVVVVTENGFEMLTY
jgi:Xaa-Pro aminopeptidase